MEEEHNYASQINSIDVNEVLQSSIVYLNKKRKFQAEVLGLPLPKHKCWDRSFSSEYDSRSNENLNIEDFDLQTTKGKSVGGANDYESDRESAKDSNSLGGYMDSATSVSEDKIQSEDPRTRPFDRPSTSYLNMGSSSFKNSLYSLDRTVTKSGADRVQSPYIGGDYTSPHNNFGLHTCLNFDEHLLELRTHIDYNCLEHENDSMELCKHKEPEDMLYSDETPQNNYVLSSGRWSVNQENQSTSKKLTIDKEFEQYFSMLML
ncbi:protein FAR-RED-ELONGATED HYPOCOTYL 1-LIKE isoform X1 [Actinidia eriantha]|uniref:protein FAR-RED-ELONGATED HYPOCOTYL 1-LIKE isoform X1 n=1 Tax=Actinidia eriantha TaxID=165200 RepID=UPI00258FDEF5|nr:protein FAR-RED-ELONGATED HYPOCOTYL 1-LIKE isoform X1 [Actinidia eriantha]